MTVSILVERPLIETNRAVLNSLQLREASMTTWEIAYSVEAIADSGTLTVENDGMSNPTARRYVTDHLLRTGDVASDAFDESDVTVTYEPHIE